jgi:hypothetical protein
VSRVLGDPSEHVCQPSLATFGRMDTPDAPPHEQDNAGDDGPEPGRMLSSAASAVNLLQDPLSRYRPSRSTCANFGRDPDVALRPRLRAGLAFHHGRIAA